MNDSFMSEKGQIAIFGGTGLIGSAVGRALCSNGETVLVFARNIEKARMAVPGASFRKLGVQENLADDLAEARMVVNFSGSPIFGRNLSEAEESRIELVKNIVYAMSRQSRPPSVFVNGSASGYYGYDNPPETDLKEEMQPGRDYWGNLVARWEREANKATSFGTRVVNVRTSVVLSTEGGALKQIYPTFKRYMGGYIKPGSQWFSWIHIEDEVKLVLEALSNNSYTGPINAASPNPVRIREFTDTLGKVMKRPSSIPIPSFLIRLKFGRGADLIFRGGKVSASKLLSTGFSFKFPDLMPALSDVIRRRV
jgi:uncharacterized protein (TIGR01777 family)